MLLYHFPLTSSSATATIANKGYIISGDNNFSSGGKLSSYAKDMGENKFYLSIPNFSLDYTLCFRAKATSNILLVSVGYTPFEITADNTWHDYVICDKKVYKDGLFLTNYNYSAGIVAFGDSEDSCQGLIQDIRIYDYALSQAEINEYSRAMVVHYPLQGNELSPNVLKDVSGFGNDTFGEGTTQFQYQLDKLRGEKIAHFVGSKQQYKVGEIISCLANDFSISLWFTANQITTYQFLFSQGRNWIGETNDNYGVNVAIVSGKLQIFIAKSIINVDTLTEGQSYHIAFSHSNGVVKTYLNGELKTTTNIATIEFKSSNTPNVFCVGKVAYGYNAANEGYYPTYCDLCDIRVYATALSAEDIKNLYNSPISVSKQHQTMAFEFKENPLYPSKYWRTPTYDEMNYILNTRTNAENLRTLGRVEISSGVYRNGCFLLPDDWSLPSGISMTITTENYFTNTYTLTQFKIIEEAGGIFIPSADRRNGANMQINGIFIIWLATSYNVNNSYCLQYNGVSKIITFSTFQRYYGMAVRLCHTAQGKNTFSTSSSTFIKLAKSNLQYHCTQHIWRFAEHSYDYIGADNANISDSYNGWIDLFGYGTSGVNYSPTLHTTNNSDYASGDIANTDNDWGVNEIQSYDYNVKNFALNKNGIVQHNELIEGSADGCYQDKLITNKLIEN